MTIAHLLVVLTAALVATANPVPRLNTATLLAQDVIDSWREPALYATAAYCASDQIMAWDCGEPCEQATKPTVLATGGDNKANPLWYVAKNGTHIIVSIAGTNPASVRSIANDIDFRPVEINTDLFPDAPESTRMHHGFQSTFERMSEGISTAVQQEVAAGTKDVLVVGHSQGGALGHLAAVHIQRKIPDTNVVARIFAAPRVGNQDWADYVDSTLGVFAQHMTNLDDIVPQLPPADWGFAHSSNEIWISDKDDKHYIACPEGESKECQAGLGLVGHMSELPANLKVLSHLGDYAGVRFGSQRCK